MDSREQLELWVAGDSRHMGGKEDPEGPDLCCPDFSCCRPELQAAEVDRRLFAAAGDKERDKMLFGFLGRALSLSPVGRVRLATDDESRDIQGLGSLNG